ncbi:S-layer homology domain-containing protein [Sporosarcina sp.]|uniref:S-layer homology domain-containing protein n=1 Tax=Sporosarcina sp. TaxID=49982 RepID=UPI002629FF05|nr:S-layer homology domain-containing protein [Sporosarcina sp.]
MSSYKLKIGVLTIALLLAVFFITDSKNVLAKEFTDIPDSHVYYKFIKEMQESGYINGYPDGTFRPDASISRKHVAKLLNTALDLPELSSNMEKYIDVTAEHPYFDEIMRLSEALIFNGGLDGKFNPDAPMTRVQMAKVLDLAFDFKMTAQFAFPDVHITHWGYPHVNALYAQGVAKGDNGKFMPNEQVSRMHYTVFLHRAIEESKKEQSPEAVEKNMIWDSVNRLSWNIEHIILDGINNNLPFSDIRSKLLLYATPTFVDNNLKKYYPQACTACDVWYFPLLNREPLVRFDYTKPVQNKIQVNTVEFSDTGSTGGFVKYTFRNEDGKLRISDNHFSLIEAKHLQLTSEEAMIILKDYYSKSQNGLFEATLLRTNKERAPDYLTDEYYEFDEYIFNIKTDYADFDVYFNSNDGMFDQLIYIS